MPELSLPDVALHYEIDGNGPAIVLIAGLMSDSASWMPLLPLLTPHFTLIRPDNRTTGRTEPWDAPATPAIWAADIQALLDHLGHKQAHIVGHSLGGNIAWQLAHDAPATVASCAMLASAPLLLNRNTDLFRALIDIRLSDAPPETWLRALFPWLFRTGFYDVPGALEATLAQSLAYPYAQTAQAMAHQLDAIAAADPAPFQSIPEVPMLAVLAKDDLLIPCDMAQFTLDGIEQIILPDTGHSIHWDAPSAIAKLILDFARQNPIEPL